MGRQKGIELMDYCVNVHDGKENPPWKMRNFRRTHAKNVMYMDGIKIAWAVSWCRPKKEERKNNND